MQRGLTRDGLGQYLRWVIGTDALASYLPVLIASNPVGRARSETCRLAPEDDIKSRPGAAGLSDAGHIAVYRAARDSNGPGRGGRDRRGRLKPSGDDRAGMDRRVWPGRRRQTRRR